MLRLRTIVAVVLVATLAGGFRQEARRGPFELRFITAHGRRTDTQFYDFTGDGLLDTLVASIDMDADPPSRWFALYVGKKGSGIPEKPDQIWSAAPSTCAFAIANVVPEGGIEVLELAPDGVHYHAFDQGSMNEEPRKLLHTRTFFTAPSPRSLPLWMGPVDLTNDKLDDLIVPAPEGYKVYFQTEPGKFGLVQKLEGEVAPGAPLHVAPTRYAADWERLIARRLPTTAGLFNFHDELPRISPVDIDGDGLRDLVALNGNRMTIFYQRAGRRFGSGPRDRVQCVIGVLNENEKENAFTVTDAQFTDINQDKFADFIVTKIQGELEILTSIQTHIFPHLGTGRANFRPDADIKIDGISLNPYFIDMNGDGKLDVLTSRLRTDLLSKGLDAMMGDLTVTYEVFQFDGSANKYLPEPVFTQDIRIPLEEIRKRGAASRPLYQVPGDLSGDKRPDAVIYNPKNRTLEVRKGASVWQAGGAREVISFSMDPAATFNLEPIDKDDDPKWISYLDVDGDGRLDILLNYMSVVGVLLSRF